MRTIATAALSCALVACSGTSKQAREAEVYESKSAGSMVVVTQDGSGPRDHEPVVVTTERELEAEGASPPTEEACVPLPVYFAADSAELDEEAIGALERVAECLKKRDEVMVRVIGHDARRQQGELEDELVAKRTAAVLEYLEQKGLKGAHYTVRQGD